jgi:phenylalanyl-tRNA synthetase beta chain
MDSAVSLQTRNVIWESATFDAVSVRLSAQRHGVRTDASTRYEKSLDPLLASSATARIYDYLAFLGKNIEVTAIGSYLDVPAVNHITLDVSYEFINMKAGTHIASETIQAILKKLGFEIIAHTPSLITLKVPSWRASKDISIQEDIAEEVIRIYGYENIIPTPLGANSGISTRNTNKELRNISLDYWKSQYWHEVYNYSFTNATLDGAIGYEDMTDSVAIQNAFNVEYTHMRRSLSVRLFDNIAKNRNIQKNLRFYEIGKIYAKKQSYTNTIVELLKHIEIKPYGELSRIA